MKRQSQDFLQLLTRWSAV